MIDVPIPLQRFILAAAESSFTGVRMTMIVEMPMDLSLESHF